MAELPPILQRVFRWLVPEKRYKNNDEYHHAKRVAVIVMALVIWSPVFSALFYVLDAPLLAGVVALMGFVCVATLALLRAGVAPTRCGNVLTGGVWLGLTTIALLDRGPAAPSIVWYVSLPVVSLWLCGPRNAMVWTGVSTLAVLVMAIARESGFEFPAGLADGPEKFMQCASMLGILWCVFGLVYVLNEMECRARSLLNEAKRRLEALAALDGLTGIANRRAFDGALEREWIRHQRTGLPISVLLIDVDNFKEFNDAVGHLAGDDCLKSISQAIAAQGRRAGDLAARYGGDEFALILPNTSERGALAVAENIRVHIKSAEIRRPGASEATHMTVSVGVATTIPTEHSSTASLLSDADEALYLAKSSGRDQVARFRSQHPKLLEFAG